MLAFDQVQPTIVTLLAAASYLTGLTIVADDGSQAEAKTIADALDNLGVAISVWPPSRTSLIGPSAPADRAAQLNMDVEAAVFIEVNPERNDPVKRLAGTNNLGTWDADTNTPDVSSTAPAKGDYYTVSVAGTTALGANAAWSVGDVAVFDGTDWQRGAAPKDLLKLVKASVQAVLAYRGSVKNPNDLFNLAEQEPITLDSFDPGLLRYHVVFQKRCVL